VTLKEKGDAATQARSEKLFDPEKDPLFVQGERVGDSYACRAAPGNRCKAVGSRRCGALRCDSGSAGSNAALYTDRIGEMDPAA